MTGLHLIVLAAGFATRLYPLTREQSKPLLEVGGEPILTRLVRQCAESGVVARATVVTNAKFFAAYERWRAALRTPLAVELVDDGAAAEHEARGAIRDLSLALAGRDSSSGYLIAGGDNVLDFDLRPFAERFTRLGKPLLVLREVPAPIPPERYSEVTLDARGVVTELREKPPDPRSPLSAICLYFVPAQARRWVADYLALGANADAPGHFFAWLVRQTEVHGMRFSGRWFDVGSPETLADARRAFGAP